MNPRQPHPMLNRLLGIADAMEEYGFGVGDPPDAPFVREAAYELEHLKRLNESTERGYETVLKVADRLQAERDALLTLGKRYVVHLERLGSLLATPAFETERKSLCELRTIIKQSEATS